MSNTLLVAAGIVCILLLAAAGLAIYALHLYKDLSAELDELRRKVRVYERRELNERHD